MTIKCSKCGASYEATAEYSGKSFQCPCGNIVSVPVFSENPASSDVSTKLTSAEKKALAREKKLAREKERLEKEKKEREQILARHKMEQLQLKAAEKKWKEEQWRKELNEYNSTTDLFRTLSTLCFVFAVIAFCALILCLVSSHEESAWLSFICMASFLSLWVSLKIVATISRIAYIVMKRFGDK